MNAFLFLSLPSVLVFLFNRKPRQRKKKNEKLTSLTNLGDSAIPALASTIDDLVSPMKSVETTASLVMPRIPSIRLILLFFSEESE